ncbi:hypothetical protein Hanom_Chr17g01580731 [Helianthus anomalus]
MVQLGQIQVRVSGQHLGLGQTQSKHGQSWSKFGSNRFDSVKPSQLSQRSQSVNSCQHARPGKG